MILIYNFKATIDAYFARIIGQCEAYAYFLHITRAGDLPTCIASHNKDGSTFGNVERLRPPFHASERFDFALAPPNHLPDSGVRGKEHALCPAPISSNEIDRYARTAFGLFFQDILCVGN